MDPSSDSLNKIPKIALSTMVRLREEHRMTLRGVPFYCKSVGEIMKCFVEDLEEEISKKRPEISNFVTATATRLLELNPLEPINTEYKVMKNLKTQCGMVEPREIVLGEHFKPYYGTGREELAAVAASAMIVPLREQLEQLYSNREIRQLLDDSSMYRSEDDGFIRCVKDGSMFKNHPICQKYPDCLLLELYNDDVEVVNPLGSHTKTHKVSVNYWTLLNLPEHVRSSLKTINLQSIAKSTDVRKFGFEAILSDFFDGIRELESERGMELKLAGGEILAVHGTLMCVSGDGLALNYIAGFKEGIGFANKPCRNCNLNRESMNSIFIETQLREMSTHVERVKEVLNPNLSKKDRDELSKNYGINSESIFSQLPNFDLTKCFPQDFMHSMLEGVEEVAIRALLFELIEEKKLLSFETLNSLISGFPYPYEFLNCKPSLIDRVHVVSGKLRQNASQMLCLLYTLPFMLEPYADQGVEKNLLNFSLLAKISNILMAYQVDRDSLKLTKYMIHVHHKRHSQMYPQFNVTPKFHFLVHIPGIIEQFGPIRVTWTMRFEAMNAWISKVGEETKNFMNIPKTLATRMQVKRCLDFEFGDKNAIVFGEKTFKIEDCQTFDLKKYRLGVSVATELGLADLNESVTSVQSVYLNNFNIKIKSFLLVEDSKESLPTFGQVFAIFFKNGKLAFVMRIFETVDFNQLTNSYELEDTNNQFSCIAKTKLPFFHPLPSILLGNKTYVILQYHSRSEFVGK